MEKGYLLKKFRLDKLKITVSISNCKKTVFNYISRKKPLKARGNWLVTIVTKRKIFDQLYLFWDIQGWTYTSQKFHVPRSRELWDNRGGRPDPPPWYPCGSKTLGIWRQHVYKVWSILFFSPISRLKAYPLQDVTILGLKSSIRGKWQV